MEKQNIRLPRVERVEPVNENIDAIYEIKSDYKRFDESMHMNLRRVWDPKWVKGRTAQRKARQRRIEKGIRGYSLEDYALLDAGGFTSSVLGGHAGSFIVSYDYAFKHLPQSTTAPHLQDVAPRTEEISLVSVDPGAMAYRIRQAGKFCGADEVGICEVDRRWVYGRRWNPNTNRADIPGDQDIGEEYTRVIVLVGAMDESIVKYSPTALGAAATELGYAMMGFTAASVAAFIRRLGFRAIPTGNDTALSIPYATMAGLGELGRHGLLIHPQHGARVRIAKIFTNLPVKPDRPIRFGVSDYCATCDLCAKACPAQCIPYGEPTTEIPNDAAAPGMRKWYIDSKKCRSFWDRNGSDCSNCIKVCPYGYETSDELAARPDIHEWWGSGPYAVAHLRRSDTVWEESNTLAQEDSGHG